MAKKPDHLRPALALAQQQLAAALDEACDSDVDKADTGELIRLEESLALAAAAAKQAISVRRRLRQMERQRIGLRLSHRSFDDARGSRWEVFAVQPSGSVTPGALPEGFQHGWLSFASEAETRRLAPIPEGWNEMPEDGLRALCEKAEVAVRRRR